MSLSALAKNVNEMEKKNIGLYFQVQQLIMLWREKKCQQNGKEKRKKIPV